MGLLLGTISSPNLLRSVGTRPSFAMAVQVGDDGRDSWLLPRFSVPVELHYGKAILEIVSLHGISTPTASFGAEAVHIALTALGE